MRAAKKGKENIEQLEEILDSVSIYKGAVIDNLDDIDIRSASLQGIANLLIQNLQVLSAGSDIPATRYLGEAPGGLNATGKFSLVNYYDGLRGQQVNRLLPQLEKLLPVLSISATGEIVPVEIKFNPLMQLAEDQQADLRAKDLTNILNALVQGIGTDHWAVKEALDRDVFLNDPLKDGGMGAGLEDPLTPPVEPGVI